MSKPKQEPNKYIVKHLTQLIGKRVVCLAHSPSDGFSGDTYGLIFDDDTVAFVMSDPEGNGPGWLSIEPPSKAEGR